MKPRYLTPEAKWIISKGPNWWNLSIETEHGRLLNAQDYAQRYGEEKASQLLIAHAYLIVQAPKLVEDRAKLVAALQGRLGYVDYVADNGNADADRHATNVRTILRELGESD